MLTQIQAWLAKVPIWLSLPLTTFLGAALSYVLTVPQADLIHDIMTGAGVAALAKGMVAAGLVAIVNLLRPATKVETDAVKAKLKKNGNGAGGGGIAATACLCLFCFGCQTIAAAFPELDAIEKTVLADVEAGKTAEQIEADVAKIVAGQAGVDIVILVNDALAFLIDAGLVPSNWVPQAKALAATETGKISARKH